VGGHRAHGTSTHRPIEQQLAQIRALDTAQPDARAQLRDVLRSTAGLAIAAAAKRVGDDLIAPLAPELVTAFEALRTDPVKRDPGCRGKIAIARALHALDYWDERVFVAGLRITQLEGFGGDDMAAELRGICGLAHAHLGRPDALDVLADLLADSRRTTRIAAAQAIGDTGRLDGAALLRLKLNLGDTEPEVLATCIESLLSLARDGAFDFVVRLLATHDDRAEAAALGLGGARIANAFEPLRAWSMGATPEQRRRVGYLALALLRSDDANAYLLGVVRDAAHPDAVAAARALATFKETLADEIRAAAREHKDAAVRRELEALVE
jgi:hypothetical protein